MGNLKKNIDVQREMSEEGSEPGALRGYAAVCHGHGTGAASFTDQDEFSDNYAEAAEVLTGMGIIQGYDDAVSCLSVTSTAHR